MNFYFLCCHAGTATNFLMHVFDPFMQVKNDTVKMAVYLTRTVFTSSSRFEVVLALHWND